MIYNTDKTKSYRFIPSVKDEAIYSKPLLAFDQGNLLIEALPPKLTEDEITQIAYKKFPFEPSRNETADVQEAEIQLLHRFRVPLQHSYELESKAYTCLLNSYRQRAEMLVPVTGNVTIDNKDAVQDFTMCRPLDGDGGTGLALLGIGGTGKTCAITTMLSHWQQVIVHKLQQGTFTQVVWLKIEPSGNNDLSSLFINFGKALDDALGNTIPVYTKLIQKKQKNGEKAELIAELTRKFSVGMLIIDEIQRLKFERNRAESFENLMTITNNSKVAMLVAGTEEAYGMIFNKYYTLRRIGDKISTTMFCRDRKYFDAIVTSIMSINWFRTAQNLNDQSLLDAMYIETSGTIDRIINVWKNIQLDYIHLTEKQKANFVITPAFIHASADKNSLLMAQQTRAHVNLDLAVRSSLEKAELDEINKEVLEVTSEIKIEESLKNLSTKSLLANIANSNRDAAVFERVRINLREAGETYTDETILAAIKTVLDIKVNQTRSEEEIVTRVLKKIRKRKQDKLPKAQTTSDFDLSVFSMEKIDA